MAESPEVSISITVPGARTAAGRARNIAREMKLLKETSDRLGLTLTRVNTRVAAMGRGFRSAGRRTRGFYQQLTRLNRVLLLIGGAGAGFFGIRRITGFFTDLRNEAEEAVGQITQLFDVSTSIGERNIAQLNVMSNALRQFGVSQQQFAKFLNDTLRASGQAGTGTPRRVRGFALLGIDPSEFQNTLDLFDEIIAKLGEIRSLPGRRGISSLLFGRGGSSEEFVKISSNIERITEALVRFREVQELTNFDIARGYETQLNLQVETVRCFG